MMGRYMSGERLRIIFRKSGKQMNGQALEKVTQAGGIVPLPKVIQPYYQDDWATIYLADCRELLPTLGTFDLVHTDPPYGINANKQTLGKGKKNFFRGGNWDSEAPKDIISGIPSIGREVIIWGGNYFSDVLPPSNDWLIWHKKNDNLTFSECEMAWSNLDCQCRLLSHHWSGEEKPPQPSQCQ